MKIILLVSMQYILLFFIIILVLKILIGPTRIDRVIALMILSSTLLALLVLYASITEFSFYLDVALVYDIFGFLGLLAIARFVPKILKHKEEDDTNDHP
ncbi:MAG: pH regulation protein F [Spirochaetia bacterium]|nr:pH regulation protein F [Spirochaetia bacterium]